MSLRPIQTFNKNNKLRFRLPSPHDMKKEQTNKKDKKKTIKHKKKKQKEEADRRKQKKHKQRTGMTQNKKKEERKEGQLFECSCCCCCCCCCCCWRWVCRRQPFCYWFRGTAQSGVSSPDGGSRPGEGGEQKGGKRQKPKSCQTAKKRDRTAYPWRKTATKPGRLGGKGC